jgi:DNA-binding MarR family transcriptional regulator
VISEVGLIERSRHREDKIGDIVEGVERNKRGVKGL